jgi:hypothetical protein|tara:strand:- start:52 stop:348 length:297 start_codon:yes stop_codon:yes gene_type:complete
MKEKNDTELMNDFNFKYSNFEFDDFFIAVDGNNGKYERIFYKIFELEPKRTGLDTLREMSNALKRFNPINESLKLALAPFTKEVEDSYSKAQDDFYGS